MQISNQTWSRGLAVFQTKCQDGEEMWLKLHTVEWLLVPDRVKLLISCDFHAQQSLEFAKNGAKSKKHPVSSSSVVENALVMREVRGEGPDWSKLTGRWNNHAFQQCVSWELEGSICVLRVLSIKVSKRMGSKQIRLLKLKCFHTFKQQQNTNKNKFNKYLIKWLLSV